jgi:cytoskeletal protein CcmA (bactofilin family)
MFSKSTKPMLNDDAPRTAKPEPGIPSLISKDLRITGDLACDGDIQVDGTIDGDVKTRMLTVGEGAHVRGAIEADSVRVCGSVTGQIQARKVDLTKTSKVMGDIIHETLSIEAGAHVEGNFRRADARTPLLSVGDQKLDLVQKAMPNPLSGKVKSAANK